MYVMAAEKEDQNLAKGSIPQYTWKKPTTVVLNTKNNPNIGKRTGKDVKLGKNIRINEHGLENFDDYFTDEESESSIASFALGPESINRTLQGKENVRSLHKTAFKEPLRPMSPFSASSQYSDASISSVRTSLPAASVIEDTSRVTSQSQISTSTVNGGGDSLGSISRSETASSKLEPPSSALQSFKTKKRLTYSAAVSNESTPYDRAATNDTYGSNESAEITMDITNKTLEAPIAVTDNIKEHQKQKQTSLRRSVQHSSGNAKIQSETFELIQDNNTKASKRTTRSSHIKPENTGADTNPTQETQKGLETRRSSRNRNKEKAIKVVSPKKTQKRDAKPKPQDQTNEVVLNQTFEKEPISPKKTHKRDAKQKPQDQTKQVVLNLFFEKEPVAENEQSGETNGNDEYDFENEEEAQQSKKPKSKKNLKDAFEASIEFQKNINDVDGEMRRKENVSEAEVTVQQRDSQQTVSESEGNFSKSSPGRNDMVSGVERFESNGTNSQSSVTENITDSIEEKEKLSNFDKGEKDKAASPEMASVKTANIINEKETGRVSDSSDNEDGFLSLSRRSMAVPETQQNLDEDDDFEVADSPVVKKRISLQPKKSNLVKDKISPEVIASQKGRKSQLQKKNTNQGKQPVETVKAHKKKSSTESDGLNDTDYTDNGHSRLALRNFVFSESDYEDVVRSQKEKSGEKRGRKPRQESNLHPKNKTQKGNAHKRKSSADVEPKSKKSKSGLPIESGSNEPKMETSPKLTPKKVGRKNKKRLTTTTDTEGQDDVVMDAVSVAPSHNDEASEEELNHPPRQKTPTPKATKHVVRRSRSSLTIVSREKDSVAPTEKSSPQPSTVSRGKGAKEYNKYAHLLGDFEEEFDTSLSENLASTIDKSVSRAISLLTTPGKSPTWRKSSGSSSHLNVPDADAEDALGASPQLNKSKKRQKSSSSSSSSVAEQTSPGVHQPVEIDVHNDTGRGPVVKRQKKRGNGKQEAKLSKSRKRALSTVASPQVMQHRRLKQLRGNDRRGSMVTSTPVVPGGKRKSAGFAITPSPNRVHGTDESTPRSILKNSSLPMYSVSSPVHFQTVPNSTMTQPIEKNVKIVEPKESTDPNLRRSKRARVKPLAWYAGERINYNRRKSGSVVVGIINPAENNKLLQEYIDPVNHNKKNKTARRKKVQKIMPPQTPRNMSIHGEVPDGCESPSIIPVVNGNGNDEKYQECVRTKDTYRFRGPNGDEATEDDQLVVCKFLTNETFSMGKLVIRALEAKDTQIVNCTMVFYVMYGKLAVEIHRTTCVLESGDSFFVPPGNTYSIQNLRDDEAKLLFFQIKDKKKKKKRLNSDD